MKNKIQIAADLLRAYFREMPAETIQADWDAVKNLEFDGLTIGDFLDSCQHNEIEDIKYNPNSFEWQESLLIAMKYENTYFETPELAQKPNDKIPESAKSALSTDDAQYAMAA